MRRKAKARRAMRQSSVHIDTYPLTLCRLAYWPLGSHMINGQTLNTKWKKLKNKAQLASLFSAVIFYGRAHQTHNDRVHFVKIMKSWVSFATNVHLHFLFAVGYARIRFHQFSTSCFGPALHFVCRPPESAEYVTECSRMSDQMEMNRIHFFF